MGAGGVLGAAGVEDVGANLLIEVWTGIDTSLFLTGRLAIAFAAWVGRATWRRLRVAERWICRLWTSETRAPLLTDTL